LLKTRRIGSFQGSALKIHPYSKAPPFFSKAALVNKGGSLGWGRIFKALPWNEPMRLVFSKPPLENRGLR